MNTVQQLEYIKKKTRWSWVEIAHELNKPTRIVDASILSMIRSTGTPEQKETIKKLYNKVRK